MMPRDTRGQDTGSSHDAAKDEIELYGRDGSSEMLPMLEGEASTPLDTESTHEYPKHNTTYQRRSYFTRFLEAMPFGSSNSHSISLASEGTTLKSRGFSGTVRTLFNYPEPDIKLRSTAWLDGLRGLAAFEVFIFHYDDGWVDRTLGWGTGDYLDPALWRLPFIRTFYAGGDAAVCLFFAISGYVLSHRILTLFRQRRHEEAYSSLSSAVFRRAIRLYMPVAIETFILMLLCRFLKLPKPVVYESAETFAGELKQYITSFVHLLMPLRYPDRWDYTINRYDGGISWTIPLEYYGSLIIFIALLFVSRVRNMGVRIGLVIGMVCHSFIKDDWIAGQFLLGMIFADWQIGNEWAAKRGGDASSKFMTALPREIFFWALFAFGFYLAGIPLVHTKASEQEGETLLFSRPFYDWLTFPLASWGLYQDRQLERYLQCVAGFCILVSVGETPILRRLTETRFVQYLGRISFGLYLCHIFLHAWLKGLDKYYLMIVGVDPETPLKEREESFRLFLAYLMMLIPSIAVNFFVGGCFERFLDKPSVNTGKRFEKWCLARGADDSDDSPLPQTSTPSAQANRSRGTNSTAEYTVTESIQLR